MTRVFIFLFAAFVSFFVASVIPRVGYKIYNSSHKEIGVTTSGTFSPVLKKGIGLGYINIESLGTDKDIYIKIRDEFIESVIVKPPFIEI